MFIETLGQCIRGTVLSVAADKLAAHGLAGFVQSFRANYICRFCCCSTDEIQSTEVSEEEFDIRTKACNDAHVQNVQRERMNLTLVLILSVSLAKHYSISIPLLDSHQIYSMTSLKV